MTEQGPEERILDAALTCLGRWGVAKTTLEDVAREAGCSRATIYRTVPGGKAALIAAVGDREIARAWAQIDVAVAGATSLEGLLVAGVTSASRVIAGHRVLQFLVAHEPDVVLPSVAFGALENLFDATARFAGPHLARFLPTERVGRAAEWVARVVLSYAMVPSSTLDPGDDADARRLVRLFLLPAVSGPDPIPLARSDSTVNGEV
ncbi:MAG: TetR/AcrR family transcriptional regulator [Acidimicrobiia bacterium]